jgi:hypothetical protein
MIVTCNFLLPPLSLHHRLHMCVLWNNLAQLLMLVCSNDMAEE